MFRKGLALAALAVSATAVSSWAATTYQVQTKLANAGGTLKVANKAVQTTVGTTVFNNFTTSNPVPVTVNAGTGYTISQVYKNNALQTIADPKNFSTSFVKTGGTIQSLIAYFAVQKSTVSTSVTGSGSISPATATVDYNKSVTLTATPQFTNGYVKAINVTGATYSVADSGKSKLITLSNVTGNSSVAVEFDKVTVEAGDNKVAGTGSTVKIYGSATGVGTLAWTQVSGPTVAISGAATAYPSFVPAAAGTYVLQVASSVNGTVLATDTVQVTVVDNPVAYMDSTCNGCHNPTTGNYPSTAYTKWSTSTHQTKGINCVTCHTDGAMPTPVNTQTVDKNTFQVLNASAGVVDSNYCAKCHSHIAITAHEEEAKADCNACHGFDAHSLARTFKAGTVTDKHLGGKFIGTAVNVGDGKTQYVTQGAICADCHNSTNSVIKGFAEGGHGHISDNPLNAFVHYDWSARTNNGTRQHGNCDRCHTAGGFAKLMGDTAVATRLNPTTGQPNNVMVCVSCHTNIETGALRIDQTPAGNGQTLAQGYFALFSSAVRSTGAQGQVKAGSTKIQVAFPGMKNSSICIPCHSGRTTDDVFVAVIDQAAEVKDATTTPVKYWGNYTTISTGYYQHAANMAQGFIGKGAFNFNGGEYAGANGHMAVKNGATDTQGPCVGCHHSKDGETHSLEPVGYSAVCQSCHAAPFGATDVEAKKEEYEAGLAVLNALIHEKFDPLRATTNSLETERQNVRFGRFGKAAGTAATAATAKSAYGAWYNWQLLTVWDRAMFVHNPTLARTVLMDTIDYLDGNGAALNGSAVTTITNYVNAAVTAEQKTATIEFLETPACASCHATQTAKIQGGKHAAEVSTHSGACGRCHTAEGYVAFLATAQSPAGSYTSTSFNGSQNVSCSACHDNHGTVRNVAWAPKYAENDAAASTQFKLCTSCHNLVNESGSVMASGKLVAGTQTVAKQQHYKDWYRNIASTHYDLVGTGAGSTIEGYNVRFNNANACLDCHGHEMYTNTGGVAGSPATASTIHTDWAQSGHAGGLLSAKFAAYTASAGSFSGTTYAKRARTDASAAAVMAAGATEATGIAWVHYDWDDSTGTASDRKACQKCHTSTGVSNFLNAVAAKNTAGDQTVAVAYNAANNDFSHLAQWTTAKKSAQNEMLYCWGCHKNAESGELRVEGFMTLDYKAASTDTSNITINVPGKAAVCVSCHAGRGNAATLFGASTIDPAAVLSASTTPKNSASATATHYLGAAASIFAAQTKTGYEYPGRNYAAPVYFKHNTIGCNDCHMGDKNHKFEVVSKDAAGVITSIKSAKCAECHSGAYEMTAAKLEEEEKGYNEAIAAFNDALIAQGYTYTTAYPYFLFTGPNAAAKWRTQGDIGAAHNFNFLKREPGAYAHNRYYAKRLIYDSIDWLDNNQMDNSVVIDAVKYPEAALWLGATRP